MEDYADFQISKFNIRFRYPEWWEHKVEHENTYLFWDEYTGSFRITPLAITKPEFNLEKFLEKRFEEAVDKTAEWKIFNNRKYLYYEELSKDEETKLHFYISGEKNVLITCSFAYGVELLEDEYSKDELEGAMEEVEKVLGSLVM